MRLLRYFLFSLLIIFTPILLKAQYPNSPIGGWRDHQSYYQTKALAIVEDRILVAAQSALFYYDIDDNSMERLSKVNGLTDAGIQTIAYNKKTKSIVIAYDNSNIDIVQNDKVYNIPDIKIRSIEGSKIINSITFDDKKAYLACGFGIVVIDLIRNEIYDTYYIGENSSSIKVNAVELDSMYVYAATVNGLLYASKSSKALASSDTWKKEESFFDTSNVEIKNLFKYNNSFILTTPIKNSNNINVFIKKDDKWDTIFSDYFSYWIKSSGDYLISLGWGSTDKALFVYNKEFKQVKIIDRNWSPVYDDYSGGEILPAFTDILFDREDMWLTHENRGLIKATEKIDDIHNYTFYSAKAIYPNGPLTNAVFSLTASKNGNIYVSPGGRTLINESRGILNNVFTFNNYWWDCLQYIKEQDTIKDILNVSIDPRDPKHLMASSWGNGVVEIYDNKIINVYNESNSDGILEAKVIGNWRNMRVGGVQYDAIGNLMIANSLVDKGFCYLTYKNVWGGLSTSALTNDAEILGLTLDNFYNNKLMWTSKNTILAVDPKGMSVIEIDPNNGSKDRTNQINCITQDLNGEIWIGTDKGVKVIYSLEELFDKNDFGYSKVTCNNIIYQKDSIAQYLLNFDNINCIMVDGGNRKWIGTERNGVFVFSPSGSEQLYHFNAENSPLFSNRVISMAQQPLSGEVFIATDRGIISYKAESVAAKQEAGSLKVFPNPVKPEYHGNIAIKGFVMDSDVRITDISGNMVAHLKSIGGQAIWNGKDFNGNRVATGVYLIFSSAKEGSEKSTGKILFIN